MCIAWARRRVAWTDPPSLCASLTQCLRLADISLRMISHWVLCHRCGDYRKEPSLTTSQNPEPWGAPGVPTSASWRAGKAAEASSSATAPQHEHSSCVSRSSSPLPSASLRVVLASLLIGAASSSQARGPALSDFAPGHRHRHGQERSHKDCVHPREGFSIAQRESRWNLALIPARWRDGLRRHRLCFCKLGAVLSWSYDRFPMTSTGTPGEPTSWSSRFSRRYRYRVTYSILTY